MVSQYPQAYSKLNSSKEQEWPLDKNPLKKLHSNELRLLALSLVPYK
jgi:hypothetical protein